MPADRVGQTQDLIRSDAISNSRLRPFRQGHLDGLCALYAIVNAFRLCLGDHPLYDEIWPELFAYLVDGLASETHFASVALGGIPAHAMNGILGNATAFVKDEYGIELIVERPIKARDQLSAKEVLTRLDALSQHPNTALLLWLKIDEKIRHWTVIEKVRPSSLSLLDSAGYRSFRRSDFQMTYEPARRRDDRSITIMKPRRIFLIRRSA